MSEELRSSIVTDSDGRVRLENEFAKVRVTEERMSEVKD
jgi:hypothetical protein